MNSPVVVASGALCRMRKRFLVACALYFAFAFAGAKSDDLSDLSLLEESYIGLLDSRFYSLLKEMHKDDSNEKKDATVKWYQKVISKVMFYEWALAYGPWRDRSLSEKFKVSLDRILKGMVNNASMHLPLDDPLQIAAWAPDWVGKQSLKDIAIISEFGPGLPITDDFTKNNYEKMVSDFNAYLKKSP